MVVSFHHPAYVLALLISLVASCLFFASLRSSSSIVSQSRTASEGRKSLRHVFSSHSARKSRTVSSRFGSNNRGNLFASKMFERRDSPGSRNEPVVGANDYRLEQPYVLDALGKGRYVAHVLPVSFSNLDL